MRLGASYHDGTFTLTAQVPAHQREAAQGLVAELFAAGLYPVQTLDGDGRSTVMWRTTRRVGGLRRHAQQLFWTAALRAGLCPEEGEVCGAWERYREQVRTAWAEHLGWEHV